MALKARVYRMCIEPVLLYGCEIWTTIKKARNRLVVAERSIMRKMAGVSRMERKTNEWLSIKVPIHDFRIRAMQKK